MLQGISFWREKVGSIYRSSPFPLVVIGVRVALATSSSLGEGRATTDEMAAKAAMELKVFMMKIEY
jgi:hypothetical protein